MCAQVVGAITGAAMAKFVSPAAFKLGKGGMNALQTMAIGDNTIAVTTSQGFFAEVMGTFLLVLAVLFCTDTARSIVHPHMTALIPLEIGLVVLIDHFVLMPLTGCSVNPARSIGSAVVYGNYTQLWIFVWGPFVGGAFAACVYSLIFSPVEAFNEYFNSRNMADRAQKRLRSISDTAGAGLGAAAGAASSIAGAVGRRVGGGSQ
jgi:glycerol uptake facilitator-like aquaporin